MTSDLIFLALLTLGGIVDLRHRRVKNWQLLVFAGFVVGHTLWSRELTLVLLLNFLCVLALGWIGFAVGRVGAADVKVIAVSSLYNLAHFNPWWVWQALLLASVIDLGLWLVYFRQRNENSPLLFAWMLGVYGVYIFS